MAPAATTASPSASKGALVWRPTKIMNMRDLSKDDDFLSHLLVEKLGTGAVPLLVHKMDPSRRLPKTDARDLLAIVRRLVVSKGPVQHAIRQAVDELLALPSIRYYLKSYTQKQINAFATHASRYFELYNPLGFIEIAHTSRYSHRTGKSELCILATRYLPAGTVITELKGSMANLTDEEDKELKRTDLRNSDIRRDFSVIHSKQMKKNHLFLGPARFVNHDCDNNCELFREGKYITFRTLRPIAVGMEITAHYGDGYFGRKNRHCLCETCEKLGRGGYAPENAEHESQGNSDSNSDSDADSDSETSSSDSDTEVDEAFQKPNMNINERRTRRGVYAILTKKEDDSDDSDEEEDSNNVPLANAQDVPADGEIELTTELDIPSDLTSLTTSMTPSTSGHAAISSPGLITLASDSRLPSCSSLSSMSSTGELTLTPQRSDSSQFRSIISTRRQRARQSQQLVTPPLSEDAISLPEISSVPTKRITRSTSSSHLSSKNKGKEKEKDSTPVSTPRRGRKIARSEELKVKKEEVEPRALRTRPPTASIPEVAKDPPQHEVPRGPDGKPLPTCFTCSNVLPVISVDSKVVWGLGLESSPRKKKNKQDCPRCMRHAAIYGQPWPARVPPHGTGFLPTPREEATPVESSSSKRFTQKVLSVLDRKLTAAASASAKSRKRDGDSSERPIKRRKTEPGSVIDTSGKIKKTLLKNIGQKRHSLPVPGEKRKRGRPRLSSPRRTVKPEKILQTNQEDAASQPRNLNGRFEKKVRCGKKVTLIRDTRAISTRAERAIERERFNIANDGSDVQGIGGGTWRSPRRKRSGDGDVQMNELPTKRAYQRSIESPKKVLPHPASSFRAGKLFSNPNPLSFALRAWASPVLLDESSEDEKPPATPDDNQLLSTTIIEPDNATNLPISLLVPAPALPLGALTFKPSPFNFAKRRWVSVSACQDGRTRQNGTKPSVMDKESALDDNLSTPEYSSARSRHKVTLVQRLISGPSYTFRSQFDPEYSSDEEGFAKFSADPLGQLMPVDYPSAPTFSDDDEQGLPILHHSYPTLPIETALYPTTTSFTSSEPGSAPNLIHAGWDSCSDASDL